MPTPICLVDAFVTDRPFSGNPAAVCLLDKWVPDAWMQGLAFEMNQAETAFLIRQGDRFGLRWFTPAVEVDLCGHATLASAHYLWESGEMPREDTLEFETKSGLLTATSATSDDGRNLVALDFPGDPPVEAVADGVAAALGASTVREGEGKFDWFIEVDSQATLESLKPDMNALAATGKRGVVVTAQSSDPAFDFVSRFFAPQSGIDEDPVTGSAHCALAPFWALRLARTKLKARQLSKRQGDVVCTVAGDRVKLAGYATTIFKGALSLGA